LIYILPGIIYVLAVFIIVKLLDRISDGTPVPEEAILHYKLGVARATHVLEENKHRESGEFSKLLDDRSRQMSEETSESRYSASSVLGNTARARASVIFGAKTPHIMLQAAGDLESPGPSMIEPVVEDYSSDDSAKKTNLSKNLGRPNLSRSGAGSARARRVPAFTLSRSHSCKVLVDFEDDGDHKDVVDDLERGGIGKSVLKTIEETSSVGFYKDKEELDEMERETLKKQREMGIFLRKDVPFNPDSKERFWYNAVNAFGGYAGLAMYACVVPVEDVEFIPVVKWLAAIYATGISFSLIVSAAESSFRLPTPPANEIFRCFADDISPALYSQQSTFHIDSESISACSLLRVFFCRLLYIRTFPVILSVSATSNDTVGVSDPGWVVVLMSTKHVRQESDSYKKVTHTRK
jgi:hypothetical protein